MGGGFDVPRDVVPVGIRDLFGLSEVNSSSLSPSALVSFVPLRVSPSCLSLNVYVWDTSCVEPSRVSPVWASNVVFGRIFGFLDWDLRGALESGFSCPLGVSWHPYDGVNILSLL